MMTLSPQQQNEAEAHARLELLSNASLLKNVMDNPSSFEEDDDEDDEELNSSSMDSNFTPPKCKGRMRRNSKEGIVVATTVSEDSTDGFSQKQLQKQRAVEKSSSNSTSTSPASVVMAPHSVSQQQPSSYAALLAGGAGRTGYNNYAPLMQHQHLVGMLAHQMPRFPSGAYSAFRHHAAPKVVVGPPPSTSSSAGHKLSNSKENVPPLTGSPPTTTTTTATTQNQSPGQDSRNELSYEALVAENNRLKEQLKEKDQKIETLQTKADGLEQQIGELRQLPTGKISHIPIEDMIRIMQEYGSEVSNQTLPKRKEPIQKASIVRQFRRWNPEFFRYFVHVNGEWVPRLGKDGELKRRQEKRKCSSSSSLQQQKTSNKKQRMSGSSSNNSCSSPDCSFSNGSCSNASMASQNYY